MSVQKFCGELANVLRDAAKSMLDDCGGDSCKCQQNAATCLEKANCLDAIANCTNIVQGLKNAGIKF